MGQLERRLDQLRPAANRPFHNDHPGCQGGAGVRPYDSVYGVNVESGLEPANGLLRTRAEYPVFPNGRIVMRYGSVQVVLKTANFFSGIATT